MFSTTFRYSLISLVDLANEARTLQARQIAERHSLSLSYLSVVLRELRRLGLVQSLKGSRGGYRLSRPADQINLLELHDALAGGEFSRDATSPAHNSVAAGWIARISERWSGELAATSLEDVCREGS